MINFANISTAILGPKGSGRTYQMIMSAPNGATVICANQHHIEETKHMSMNQGRRDLGYIKMDDELKGLRGPFILDHYTIECLLKKASLIQNDYEQRVDMVREKNHQLEMSYHQLLEENKKLKEELNKND